MFCPLMPVSPHPSFHSTQTNLSIKIWFQTCYIENFFFSFYHLGKLVADGYTQAIKLSPEHQSFPPWMPEGLESELPALRKSFITPCPLTRDTTLRELVSVTGKVGFLWHICSTSLHRYEQLNFPRHKFIDYGYNSWFSGFANIRNTTFRICLKHFLVNIQNMYDL